MQQKAFEESRYPWQESFENVAVCLPFRCPRCGDHTRFRSLSSLRAHLEFSHSYQERTLLTKCSIFPSIKDTDLVTSSEPLKQGKLQSCGNIVKQRPSYVNLYSISHEHSKDRKPFEVVAERPVSYVQTYTAVDLRADSLDGPRSSPGLPTSDTKAAFEAHVREKFSRMVEAVDRTIEKRIDKLTKELAQKTAELLEVRAAFVQLTQKKQEVQRRERALNRQVDVAVEMIAALRQRLTESEEELLRKEEEVVTFNHFLEAAAEKEVQGKARLQDFIENLLHRVEMAEKQLEYYHGQHAAGLHWDTSEHGLTDIASNRKPKCLRCSDSSWGKRKIHKWHSYLGQIQVRPRKHLTSLNVVSCLKRRYSFSYNMAPECKLTTSSGVWLSQQQFCPTQGEKLAMLDLQMVCGVSGSSIMLSSGIF
ncbi:protein ZNF365 isoform X1 [Phacochoerus africanus]|uniref:protein ZNF365 isoform X1 n=1 Tax=Phacochoerus africanus TaxID=41426 RepID=UPI001FD95822|nr:protein ZNF365 isoform X1 [Phacochoerus africanus]